jgi:hypothetical protein
MSLDSLKPLEDVLIADARWGYFGRSLEGHHGLVASIMLNDRVPEDVRQQYENARNAWLCSFFAYRLLSVAFLTLLVACESAIRACAAAEGYQKHALERLVTLLKHVLSERWVLDDGFSAASDREQQRDDQRRLLMLIGEADIGSWFGPADDQEHSRALVDALRHLRNSLAHGETLLKHNLSHEFQAVADFINQLFPRVDPAKGSART